MDDSSDDEPLLSKYERAGDSAAEKPATLSAVVANGKKVETAKSSSDDEDLPLSRRKAAAPMTSDDDEVSDDDEEESSWSGDEPVKPGKGTSGSEAKLSSKKKPPPSKPSGGRATKTQPAKKRESGVKAAAKPPADKNVQKKAAKQGDGDKKGGKEDAATPAKKPKKIYDLSGQIKDTPDETDPLRKFYSSLRQQIPGSEMAAKWLCQHGLLDADEAEAWVARQKGLKSPIKNPAGQGTKSSGSQKQNGKRSSGTNPSSGKEKSGAKRQRTKQRDVAFSDGGLDGSDSDDDGTPLIARKRILNRS